MAAATYISTSSSILQLRKSKKGTSFVKSNCNINYPPHQIVPFSKNPLVCLKKNKSSSSQWRRRKPSRYNFTVTAMQWQDCITELEVDVPCSVAYECYSDRETIPKWMPFISSVTILKDKPDLSKWSLKYEVFGRNVEFSWLARNLKPIPNQKIHWRSLEGLQNRGAVRFYPKGPSACRIQLTVSYEIPEVVTCSISFETISRGIAFKRVGTVRESR